jgi:hypothetical protein
MVSEGEIFSLPMRRGSDVRRRLDHRQCTIPERFKISATNEVRDKGLAKRNFSKLLMELTFLILLHADA